MEAGDQTDQTEPVEQAGGLPPWDCMATWTQAERDV